MALLLVTAWLCHVTRHLVNTSLHVLSKNMLPVFLLANLLTGAVNAGITTIETSDTIAVVMLVVYTRLFL